MLKLLISAVLLTLAPPDHDISSKHYRVAEIRALAQLDSPGAMHQFTQIIEGQGAIWERQLALTLLRPVHKGSTLVVLARLSTDKNAAIQIEASVQWYRLSKSKKALAALKRQLHKGANLRRAFQVGNKKGRPLYDAQAQQIFMASVRSNNLYTRLDGAMGLIELNGQGPRKAGFYVLESALSSTDAQTRLTAINHLSVQYHEPAFLEFLKAATLDADVKVKARALAILAHR
jgi:hypothetical protein